jgi:hypothetical protein
MEMAFAVDGLTELMHNIQCRRCSLVTAKLPTG